MLSRQTLNLAPLKPEETPKMALNLTQKLIFSHLVEGEITPDAHSPLRQARSGDGGQR